MITPRKLKSAPIKEAVIDLRVALKEEIEVEKLDSAYSSISKCYPKKETLLSGKFGFQFEEGKPVSTTVDGKQIGYRYTSEDGKYVVLFRIDGFTLSRMEPYTTWEDLRDEAAKLWDIYQRVANVETVSRVATRYINVMYVPIGALKDFGDYLTCPPEIPEALPQGVSSFLSRIVFHDPAGSAQCILTQALEGVNVETQLVPIVIDIDVFIERPFPVTDKQYWQELDDLRYFKNKVFFESITEKAEALFQ